MRIGNVVIDNPVVLAPMAGVTDKGFRIIVKEKGCGLIYTEMVSAKALTYKNERTLGLIDLRHEVGPVSVQLFGSEPEIMAEAAKIVEDHGADIIDINMGCPVPKVVKNNEGSALLNNPSLAASIVKKVVEKVKIPVTVKIRKGWDENNINGISFAQRMEDSGAAAVAIHGRTRSQYYSGQADWDIIRKIKNILQVPVLGNGDIFSPQDGLRMIQETGCDGIMVGRGAMGNPWIFPQLTQLILAGTVIPGPSLEERIGTILKHVQLAVKYSQNEERAIKEMRKHIAWYFKGLPHGARIRDNVNKLCTFQEIKDLLYGYMEKIQKE